MKTIVIYDYVHSMYIDMFLFKVADEVESEEKKKRAR